MSLAAKKISSLNIYPDGKNLERQKIIELQRELLLNKNTFIADDFIEFLHEYNGFSAMGGSIYGIFENSVLINNIYIENMANKVLDKVVLGHNEFDFLFFDCKEKKYQICDKVDFEVIDEFDAFDDAFFKIINI